MAEPAKRPVVLVHGAWHGAWCWERVIPLLDTRGIEATAVELPFTSPDGDEAAARATIEQTPGAVVLGHSYGGVVISAAACGLDVSHLVYLCAILPDRREDVAASMAGYPRTPLQDGMQPQPDGSLVVDPAVIREAFYADCDPADVERARTRLRPVRFGAGLVGADDPAWHHIPSTYVVCTQDRALHPDWQQLLAKRATHAVEWDTSHSPFYTRPELVADLLDELASV